MAGAKFEIEKFTGQNDFGLWKTKMKAVLMQQGAWKILKDGKPLSTEGLPEKEAAKMEELEYKAHSTLLLYLNDRVLRELQKEETTLDVWVKLESLYATKSTTNRLHLKNKLLAFKITDSEGLLKQLEEFHRLLDDLEAIEESMKDEDKALMLLHALPRSYVHFKEAILLARETKVSYEEVYQELKLKDVEEADALRS